jgi:short subunit dehydrogenase-like uncharacterized protein
MTIPWGDISTAYRTTGIPNIRVYSSSSPKSVRNLRRIRPLLPVLRLKPVQRLATVYANRRTGPSEEERLRAKTELWGRVVNAKGDEVTMTNIVDEGYTFTVKSSIAAMERVLASTLSGSLTPALAFGANFVNEV